MGSIRVSRLHYVLSETPPTHHPHGMQTRNFRYPYHVINATLASALPIQDFKTRCVFISPLRLWAVHVARHEVRFGLPNTFKDRGLPALQEAQNRRNLVKIEHPANSLESHFLL